MSKVVVCLPVYNGMQYIERCIKSVLEQSFTDFEFAIFVNESSDETLEFCLDVARRDSRITVYPAERFLTATENFQRAWDFAEQAASYFLIIAHDDYISPNYLHECVNALERDKQKMLAAPSVSYVSSIGVKGIFFDKRILNLDNFLVPFSIRRISFPASWFYGVYRKGSTVTISEALQLYPDGWGVDRLCVQLFLLRDKIVFCEDARIFVQTGSDSAKKYMQKSFTGQVSARFTYFNALWAQRSYLKLSTIGAKISFWMTCLATSAHDTNYTIERIILRKK